LIKMVYERCRATLLHSYDDIIRSHIYPIIYKNLNKSAKNKELMECIFYRGIRAPSLLEDGNDG